MIDSGQELLGNLEGLAASNSAGELLEGSWLKLLHEYLPRERVLSRYIDRVAYASDASMYRLIPKAVVQPLNCHDISNLFKFATETGIPLTFRAAGTSLSGQAVTDGILVDLSKHWNKVLIESDGARVKVQPGVVGQFVNNLLAKHGTKIGPDPASIHACMLGGILANNASGMCCGVAQNAYHTLASMKFILPTGVLIDTSEDEAEEKFQNLAPEVSSGLLSIRQEILSSPELLTKIRQKYLQKNTTGYSLNAFVDYNRSVDIMQHLLIGSEGTLAFIAEAELKTVPSLPFKYTGLLMFHSIVEAAESILPLIESGAVALELMDRAALRSVETLQGIPSYVASLSDNAAGLLVEYQAETESKLQEYCQSAARVCATFRLCVDADFTSEKSRQAMFWHVRKGMFPSVGAVRAAGSTVIIEDIVFPLNHLANGILGLQALFDKHRYQNAIIFGHAKDGNLHFVITPEFNSQAEIDRYSAFMNDLVELVVSRFGGALKAEHGTGRNIAPFVEAEWGGEAYDIMCRLKKLIDPESILNPGVIINSDPNCFIKDIKSLPQVEEEVDKCMECGFCESKCPSRTLTLSPRQRIVVRRELARGGDKADLAALKRDFQYDGIETCATDGLCALACPVGIDTGGLVKRLRSAESSKIGQAIATMLARQSRFVILETVARSVLRLGHLGYFLLGKKFFNLVLATAERLSGKRILRWGDYLPSAAGKIGFGSEQSRAEAIYFSTCVSRILGKAGEESKSVPQLVLELSKRADVKLFVPDGLAGLCCGTVFSSKGYDKASKIAAEQIVRNLYCWSLEGGLPIVIDASPCAMTLKNLEKLLGQEVLEKYKKLVFLDSAEYVETMLLPRLNIREKQQRVALHPVCSVQKQGLQPALERIAYACSDEVYIPPSAGCCGVAGDRGLMMPELSRAAIEREGEELSSITCQGYYSTSRTCELGLRQHTGFPFQSILSLVDKASQE